MADTDVNDNNMNHDYNHDNNIESKTNEINETNELDQYVYPIDIFLKYRNVNRSSHQNFKKYYIETLNNFKYKRQDILDRQDLRTKVNFVITKRHISNEDEALYKLLMKTLNKVNNNMLS